MPGRKPKDVPSVLKELDELIRILELADKGQAQKQIGLELERDQSHVSRQIKEVGRLLDHAVLRDSADGEHWLTDESTSFLGSLRQARQVLEAALGPQRFGSVRLRVGAIPSVL